MKPYLTATWFLINGGRIKFVLDWLFPSVTRDDN